MELPNLLGIAPSEEPDGHLGCLFVLAFGLAAERHFRHAFVQEGNALCLDFFNLVVIRVSDVGVAALIIGTLAVSFPFWAQR